MKKVSVKSMTKKEWRDIYDQSLADHLKFFGEAAKMLGIPQIQIKKHDQSKTSPEEYIWYVRKFGGKMKDPEYAGAWLHHIRNNPHHWQHWLIPPGKYGQPTTVPMPDEFVWEMVADWMGSNRAYQKSFDMTGWLQDNLHKIVLHPNSRKLLNVILIDLNYDPDALLGGREVWE
jgi:hypothetical protein